MKGFYSPFFGSYFSKLDLNCRRLIPYIIYLLSQSINPIVLGWIADQRDRKIGSKQASFLAELTGWWPAGQTSGSMLRVSFIFGFWGIFFRGTKDRFHPRL